MRLNLLLACVLLSCHLLFSQNQTSKWLYGQYTGLDFMTTPPSVITSSMYTSEGCSSIADNAGNLLFYTNGVSIWDQSNAVMANGSGLFGNTSTTQSSLIVKQPGNANIYYVFTLDQLANPYGLQYSVVDMNLAVGMGSVTVKNVPLHTPNTERLAGVLHCNKTDTWVMTHDWGTNVFRAYLLTANGLQLPAVTSTIGTVHLGGNSQYAKIGSMKFSPNGKKLGVCLRGGLDAVELYDFDNATGLVSNLVTLSNIIDTYGCEFSPDGSKFYAGTAEPSSGTTGYLYQWDLCAGSPQAMASSSVLIDSGFDKYRMLQLAMDGKIYVAHSGYTPIGVIGNPNTAGPGCNYADAGQPAGLCQLGLPSFVASYFKPALPPFSFSMTCQTASFVAGPYPSCDAMGYDYTGVSWNFGDASPQGSGFNSNHFYQPGTYTVLCILNKACTSDTLKKVITVPSQFPTFNISGPAAICKGDNTTLGISNTANTYTWLPGSIVNNLAVVNPTSTTVYTVTGTNTLTGCTATKSFTLNVSPCTTIAERNLSNTEILLYPNPSDGKVNIRTLNKNREDLQVEFMDVSGRIVKSVILNSNESEIVDLKDISNGIYLVAVKDKNRNLVYSGKIIKQD